MFEECRKGLLDIFNKEIKFYMINISIKPRHLTGKRLHTIYALTYFNASTFEPSSQAWEAIMPLPTWPPRLLEIMIIFNFLGLIQQPKKGFFMYWVKNGLRPSTQDWMNGEAS